MITLPKNPKIKDIPVAVSQLIKINFDFKKLLELTLLDKINKDQFLFLVGVASHEGKNFNSIMNFIKAYINSFDKTKITLLLEMELILHNIFLKKYETEETYNIFYNFISKLYKDSSLKLENTEDINKILFYVHAPTFLAHTLPLFDILVSKKNLDIKVSIAANGFKKEFKDKCDQLGVKFYDISDKNYILSYEKLKNIGNNYDRIIWQSVPVHLSYFRSIYKKTCYWSLKFHPNIPNLMHYIGVFNGGQKQIIYNKNVWKNFNISFKIKNLSSKTLDWKKRKLNFGAFCREELINDTKYWETVKSILENNKKAIFHYCGRTSIHKNWIKKLDIDEERIIYLGWLKDPQIRLKQMSFLLDGYKLGHGYLAVEAMAAEVPIIYPKERKAYGNVENFLIKTSKEFNVKNIDDYKKKFLLYFRNKSQLIKMAKRLLEDESFNKYYGKQYKRIANKIKGDSFEQFCNLIR